jgi:protein involved in polysaccharide export with SLBB domain
MYKKIASGFLPSVKLLLVLICLLSGWAHIDAQQTTSEPKTKGTDTTKLPVIQDKNNNNINQLRKEVAGGLDNTIEPKVGLTKGDSLAEIEKKIFGFAVFHNANSSFTPNLNMATPKSYIVGPGDALILQVYGVAQSRYALTVSPEGTITIPDIGVVRVSGFSIDALKTILINKLAIRYSGISGASPNTFLELTIGNIRTIKVNMVGEISRPGTYVLPSYVNVFNALFAAGGPTSKGTFRYVQVYRANRLVAEIDIYDFLINGKIISNIRMEDDDVILIRPATNRVEIAGEVRTTGIFELKPKETFTDALKYAGGFTDMAYKSMVNITRKGVTEMQVFDLPNSQFTQASLNDGDYINVGAILDRYTNRVQISGSVNRPGAFAFTKGMTAQDLIQKGGGLKGDAFLKRALIFRTKSDFTQEAVTVNLSNTNGKDGAANIELQREDVLSISSIYDIQEEFYVQVLGEVNNGGVYPYADSLTVGDLIYKAGGFKYSASGSFIEIVRRIATTEKVADILTVSINKDLSISEAGSKLVLKPFDQVFIRATPGFEIPKIVNVTGEVMLKGAFAIDKKEMRISDLLTRAGGITKYAYVAGATLVRRTKKFVAPTNSELENNNLNNLKSNMNKDNISAVSESNRELNKRIDTKIKQNVETVTKEQDIRNKELLKQNLFKDNTATFAYGNTNALDEKEQELVAIDLADILKKPGSDVDLVLKEGDILNIPEKLETVSIKGGVLYPVSVRYEPSLSFNEYINRSGGYTTKAIRNKAYVLQANGRVQRVKTFMFFRSYPKIEPGAEIFVPATLFDKAPFNYGNTVGAVTSLITSTLTLIILLRTL